MVQKAENFFSESLIKDNPLKKLLLTVRENSITTDKLADGVVTVDKIADGAISEEKLDKELQALLTGKYISIDELDTLKDPLIQTGLYYVYNLKTEDYTQIVGILLVQTDTEYHQVTQHFFSNYNMSSDDKTHNDKQATYYKRHYGVNSSDIDTGTWTDWEDAVVNNVNLQNILNSLDTTYLKREDNTGTFGPPIFNNATFNSPVFNNVSFKQPFISGDFNSIPFLKGSNLFLTDNGFKYAGDITNASSGCTLGQDGLKINDDYFFNSSQGLHIANDIYLNTSRLRYKDLTVESYQFIYGSTDSQNAYYVTFTSGQFTVNCSSTIDIKGENILINNLYGNGITISNSNDIIVTGKGLLSSDNTKQSITTLWNTAGSTTSLTDYANITDDTITINGKSITVSPQKEVLSFAEIVDNVTITQASTTSWDSIVYDKTHKTFLAMANTGTELQPVYTYYNNWTTRENYCAEAEGVPYSERIYTDGVSTYYFNGTDLVCIGRDIPTVELSNLDTVLGSTYLEVGNAIATKNGNRPFRYIVVDDHYFVGYIDMFGDNLRHCLTQEFTTNYLLDEDGAMSTSHDHKLHKYVRYYNISWSSATDWRGEAWAQGTWTKWNSPVEDVEASVKTKVGYLALVSTTATTTTIGAFADESGYTIWQKNPEKYASYLLTSVEIPTSGGGSSVTNCGFFVSEDSLKTAYPSPILGMMAFVGTGISYTIYRCTIAGEWTETPERFTIEFPLDDYTTLEEFNKAVSTLQSTIDAEATARQTADESMQADIDAIKTGDLPLVTPSIKANTINPNLWLVYKADGTLVTSSNDKTLNVPYGYKVNFNGCMTWSKADGYKNPTAMDGGDWGSKALPVSGELSDVVSYSDITEDKTITAKIKAPKQGLVYKNGIIKWADSTDNDSTSASVKVHFQYKVVASVSENAIDAASLVTLLTNSATLQDGKSKTLTGVTTSSTQYYVYAYPSKLGKLSKIVMNEATPLLDDGFTLSTITVTEPTTGATIEYYVYTSVQKGAFTNVKLDIA